MASLPAIKPLDGADGFLRWKETVLLHLHAAGVGHVLSEDPPPPPPGGASSSSPSAEAATRTWARDDAVCRGHILAALSDRLLPDYVRYGTGRAVWEAVARTYHLDEAALFYHRFLDFRFDDGAPLLEQLAHLHAMAVHMEDLSASGTANMARGKLPADAQIPEGAIPEGGKASMT
ncbi:hypothetical protein HU200_033400 [Digitaria exilis]|uniref:Uncharacterized protein n=1 Tax=Digitaria exilis TaxID=1010633 RepID=A0A835BLL8_9POAL|nr:hypothetical protein HU200_033400 [Digitaria exilis]CAB3482981.1 unnamed protein product [Digitaria exilis]